MTQKFPFDHFLKLDGINDAQPVASKIEIKTSPLIVDQALKSFSNSKITPEFATDELKIISDALLEHIKSLINPEKHNSGFLYQIVSNSLNGLDVDKYDYLARDIKLLGKDKDVWQHPLFGNIKVDDPRLKLYKEHFGKTTYLNLLYPCFCLHLLLG